MSAIKLFRALTAAALMVAITAAPSFAAPLRITTPYPAVAVAPGETTSFPLEVTASGRPRVDLQVTQVPKGWSATLRGGGFIIDGVYATAGDPPSVVLDVDVPADAKPGVYRVVVTGTSSAGTDVLPLDLRVARRAAGGRVSLEADFPSLRGDSDATFTFDLQLDNQTPEETTFTLESDGPRGWKVDARPSGQQQAASITVAGGGSTSIQVEVDPPADAVAGTYPIRVRATGGGKRAQTLLEVEITGNVALRLTTPDERLNADVRAGRASDVELLIVNDGTAPLTAVELSATPPADWEVEFTPEIVEVVPPGESVPVTATITPSGDAIAGDYVVTLSASVDQASEEVELRTTVETTPLWGVVAILLIAGTLFGLNWVFRRFGRR